MNKQDEQFLKIKQIYPDSSAIYKPITLGRVRDVYIVEQGNDKYVCRFADSVTMEHNLKISQSLLSHNLPVPQTKVFAFNGEWCETYPFIEGKTLHERLLEGLKGEKLDNVYRQLIDISYKISEVPYDETFNVKMPLLSKILRKTFAFLNPSETKLVHTDLHAKNVLLDKEDNICAILDLDAIYPEHLSVSDIIIMKDAQTYGYNIQKFKGFNTSCNVDKIAKQIKSLDAINKIYCLLFSECIRKRMLNVRIK